MSQGILQLYEYLVSIRILVQQLQVLGTLVLQRWGPSFARLQFHTLLPPSGRTGTLESSIRIVLLVYPHV